MPRQIFKRCVIAIAGPLPGQLTTDNIRHWTELRKGRFSEELDDEVTHLLCTSEQFNKRVRQVKDALHKGKRLHIVHYDWFEFSTVYEKKQPEKEYSMRAVLAEQQAARREKARVERGKRNGEKFVNTNLFHIYHDREFFPYDVVITRDDIETGDIGQRYRLCLWESDAKPHLYWFTAKFLKKKGDSQPSYYRPSHCSGKWRAEIDLFMEFFRIKTGIEWQDRVLKEKTMPPSYFQYTPPAGGKPVGRRLRFNLDYCREINAQLRGLPWPPVTEQVIASDSDHESILPDQDSDIIINMDGTEDSHLSIYHSTRDGATPESMPLHSPNDDETRLSTACITSPSQEYATVLDDCLSVSSLMETAAECRDETGQVRSETDDPNLLKQCFTTPLPRLPPPPPPSAYATTYSQSGTPTDEQMSGVEHSPQGLFGGLGLVPNLPEPKLLSGDSPTTSKFIFSVIDDAEAKLNREGSGQHRCTNENCSHEFVKVVRPPPPNYTPSAQGVAFGFDIQYPCDRADCEVPHVCVESPGFPFNL